LGETFDTLYQNRTAKHRHIELQRAECKKFRKCIFLVDRIIQFVTKVDIRTFFCWKCDRH